MSSEWKEFSGELPAALQGLGAVPVHHADAFWMRLGSAILVAGTPPNSIFPKGTWVATAMPSPEAIAWHAPVKHGEWSVSQSTDGHYLRVDDHGPKTDSKSTHFYVQHIVLPLTLHVHGAQRVGSALGAASSATIAAAQGVVAYFTANPCTQQSVLVVSDFQNAWNADQRAGSSSRLTADGQYGPLTQGALESALGTTAVPANCFGGPAQPVPPDPPLPAPVIPPLPAPSPTPTPSTGTSTGVGPLPYIIGAVVVAGALAAYTYSNKKKGH